MPTFPRTIAPSSPGIPQVPGPLLQISAAGSSKSRGISQTGRVWSEKYPPLDLSSDAVWTFITTVLDFWHQGTIFDIVHPYVRGSGLSPGGTGSGGVTVNGASQTGSTLSTTGWPLSTADVVKAGDLIRVAGLNMSFMITANASSDGAGVATLPINPPIFVGNSPANAAAVTTTNNVIRARIASPPQIGNGRPPLILENVSIDFMEVP